MHQNSHRRYKSNTLNMLVTRSMAQKQAHTKRTTSTEAAGNLTEREKGSFCFLIIDVSYNARYAKLREAKKPISRIFVVSASAGSFFGLA